MSQLRSIDTASTRLRQRIIEKYKRRLLAATRGVNGHTSPVAWWKDNAVDVIDALTWAQIEAGVLADETVQLQLETQGAPPSALHYDPRLLAGRTGDGRTVHGLVGAGVSKVATAYDTGEVEAVNTAWQQAKRFLVIAGSTAISDASRSASSASMLATPRTKYVRMINPPTCARCLVLAGRTASTPTMGFKRHPGCDCSMVAVYDWDRRKRDPMYRSLYFDNDTYFESLSEADQDKLLGKAGAQAVRDGADFNQVVNARRGMSEVTDKFGNRRKVTTEGTTKRGTASKYMQAQLGGRFKKTPGSRYTRLPVARLTPEEIYKVADGSTDKARVLLHQYGYLTDVDPRLGDLWGDPEQAAEIARLYEKTGTTLRRAARH